MAIKPWSRSDSLILLLFVGLVILFFWPILTPNLADRQSFPPGDFAHQFWAFATFEVRELSAGRLPLWNPYTFAGAPFWADVQAAVLYPPSLLTLLLSGPGGFSLFALEVEAIAHYWLAATFMYLFVRQLTANRPAGLIAALTFAFSGYLTGYPSQQLAILEADVWLPLILFFLHQAHQRRQRPNVGARPGEQSALRPLLLAGLAWGLALLAGHPQSALIIAYLSSAYHFFLGLSPARASFRSLLGHWVLFIGSGLALAAIQFLPAMEYTLRSVRAAGVYDKMSGGFPLIDLIQLLLPGQVSLYSPLYVGIIGLILAVGVALARPSRHVFFWAGLAVVTLLISFGGNTFIYSPLYLVGPGFSIFRGQERWAVATAFSLSVLVGYAFQQLAGGPETNAAAGNRLRHGLETTLSRLTAYLFYFALLVVILFFFGLNEHGWNPENPFFALLSGATFLTLLLALAWLLWGLRPYLPAPLFTGLSAALICFDLFTVNWQTNLYPQPPEWHTQQPAIVTAIRQDGAQGPAEPFRVYNEFRLYDNYGIPFALEDLWGASPLRPARYDRFLAPPMPLERTWQLLNVKYVITWRQELFVPSTIIYQEATADGPTYLHRLRQVGPRAWLVNQVRLADDVAILAGLADAGFDPGQLALLEAEAAPFVGQLQAPPAGEEDQTIQRLSYTPNAFTYRVSSPGPALLILSEPDYPGWQARLNGQPVPLLRANFILRAVPLPAGEHTIDFMFRPLSFTLGAVISSLSLIIIAGLTVHQTKWLSFGRSA